MRSLISRAELFATLGVIRIIDPLTDRAYAERELKIWEQDLENSPHGQPWHTSFHASSFPGDDPTACGRRAIYGLLNLPNGQPTGRFLRAVGDAGKAIESELVRRWYESGILLSAPDDSQIQTGFEDRQHWLTGSTDAVVLPYRWRRPHVIEVKSKSDDKIEQMKQLSRSYFPEHRRQCLTYVGLLHEQPLHEQIEVCKHTWKIASPQKGMINKLESMNDEYICKIHHNSDCLITIDLEPCTSGSIYYVSRDNPSNTFEYYFAYDPDFMDEGRAKLANWKASYETGVLPERPRNAVGKVVGWSEEPCKWCPLKKEVCKPDFQAGATLIEHSHAHQYAQRLKPDYDSTTTREEVVGRWIQQ